ncbi:HTTM domain-containing protein [Leucobacter sp. HNU]|uniref:HTTM domain-containing protein n=1 Tax=Leucobacter sp. HNU TaxID=3236805 RepID=UPI003A7FEA73
MDSGPAANADDRPIPRVLVVIGSLIGEASRSIVRATMRGIDFLNDWLFTAKRARYGIAVTRVFVGLAAIGMLLTNFSTRYYSFGSGAAWNGEAANAVSDFPHIFIFSLFHQVMMNDGLLTTYYLVLFVLAILVVLGWRFRLVLPVYFVLWVGFIESNDMLGDQGDNMYRIVLILMLFTDAAGRWSLDARRRVNRGETFRAGGVANRLGTLAHNLAIVALAAQVILVYTSGALFKAGGAPWQEGRGIYDPLSTARFGTWPALSDLITAWGPLVAVISLGTVFLQAAFPFMLLRRGTRIIALVGMLMFHLGIAVLMGLPWFSMIMVAVDSIFIRDRTWKSMTTRLSIAWQRTQKRPMNETLSPPSSTKNIGPQVIISE